MASPHGNGKSVRVAVGVLLALATGVGVVARLLGRGLPQRSGAFRLPGVRAEVEIIYDRWGVPHIYGQNLWDTFFGQGYCHARDRLWQLDFYRRVAAGTLSEVVGEAALEADRLARRLALRPSAQGDYQRARDEVAELLDAFAAGINAYLEGAPALPPEFTILRYRPAPWAPADSLAIGKLIPWTQSPNWDLQLIRSWLLERVGLETLQAVEPTDRAGEPLVVPAGGRYHSDGGALARQLRADAAPLTGLATGGGSNSWVVDGSRTATGKPLLANDPHLTPTIPTLWYENHLVGGGLDVIGASLLGVPGVIVGHNQKVAWGITAALADVQDLYLEERDPRRPDYYRRGRRWRRGQLRREVFTVRGRPEPLVEEVLVTEHGPDIGPAIAGETRTLTLRSAVLEPSHIGEAVLRLNRAANWEEFRRALALWTAPPLNLVYADVDGNIGYQFAGLVPKRRTGHGLLPAPGYDPAYRWDGFVPFDELPTELNPSTHSIATANNRVDDDDYRHHLSSDWGDGYRMERLAEMLQEKERLGPLDFVRMQQDVVSLPARELVRRLTALESEDPRLRMALDFLRGWDYRMREGSVAACIFEATFAALARRIAHARLGDDARWWLGQGLHVLLPSNPWVSRLTSRVLELVREGEEGWLPEPWDRALLAALGEAVDALEGRFGPEMLGWRWGRLHQLHFRHVLGRGPLAVLFNRGPYPLQGSNHTVCAGGYAFAAPFEVTTIASYRQIIDLSNLNNSFAVLPTGQSGHPRSRHYDDMLPLWRNGEYHQLYYDRIDVVRHSEGTVRLLPVDGGG